MSSYAANKYVFVRCPQDGANPQSLLVPPSCSIWLVTLGSPEQVLVQGGDAYLYAGQNTLVRMQGRELLRYNLSAFAPTQLSVILELQSDQGSISSVDMGSDGRILFVNNRGDRQIAGLVKPQSLSIMWLDPTLDLILGKAVINPLNLEQVAFRKMFVRTDAGGNSLSYDIDVIVCDTSGAKAVCNIATSFLKTPSTECCASGQRLMGFITADLLAVPIVGPEGFDPYDHVALVNVTSGQTRDLFEGQKCDVLSFQINPSLLLATHNCYSNTTETQGITLHGAPFTSMTIVQPGIYGQVAGLANERQYGAVWLNSGATVYFMSSFNVHFAVYSTLNGSTTLVSRPPRATPVPFTLPVSVTYETDFLINAHVYMPDASKFPPPYRAVIYTHGGPMRQVYPAPNPMWDYTWRYAMNQYLSSIGVVVMSINYRMGVGYGTKFQYCDKCGKYGGKEYDDVLAGAQYLLKQAYVKGPKVGIYGLSYGGLNALQAATRNPDLFDASVANAPVYNWIAEDRADGDFLTLLDQKNDQMSGYWPPENLATPQWSTNVNANMKLFYESSPAAFFTAKSAPLLLIQGDSDRDVAIQATLDMYNQARLIGANVQSLFYPNQMHGLSLYSSQSEAAQKSVDFLLSPPE